MSKSGRDKRDAERAARRAQRLAERAEERAKRKEGQATRAAERAERLAERVSRRPGRQRDLDRSIEDLVDEVTQKAEDWIDEHTRKLFDPKTDREAKQAQSQAKRAQRDANRARESARRAEREAEELEAYDELMDDDLTDLDEAGMDFEDDEIPVRQKKKSRKRSRRYGRGRAFRGWPRSLRHRTGNLYRDKERKKVCGVCAGTADYFGRPVWEIRLYAVLGLFFIPSFIIPTYFIMYFLMDDKPYYRRVTDRFAREEMDRQHYNRDDKPRRENRQMQDDNVGESKVNNVQAMKVAKGKFSDIEQRLRQMETHVTSSRFELQRELKKISGEDG